MKTTTTPSPSLLSLLLTLITILTITLILPAAAHAREPRWEAAMKKFDTLDAQTSPPQNAILFTGSSSIVGWKLGKFFPDLPVINRGFGGSKVSDVIDYFDRVILPYKPSTIVFYSGDNDIAGGKTTTTVNNDIKQLVTMIHDALPETRIILLPPKPSISRWKIYPQMQQVAQFEKQLADQHPKVQFLDIATPMLGPDGKPKPELFLGDKLHMTEQGYIIWSDLLRPLLTDKPTTAAATTTTTADATKYPRRPQWQADMKKFDAQDAQTSPPKNPILFVGSSSIVRWKLDQYFPDLPVLNRGFGGSQTFDVIAYFDRVIAPYEPSTIVFYSGDNDINSGKTPQAVFDDVKTLVNMVHQKFPDTRFIILPPKPSIARWNNFPKMHQVAQLEKQLAEQNDKVEFLDTATPLLGPDGTPDPKYLIHDKLHMTPQGYEVWSNLLRPILNHPQTTPTK